MVGLTGFEPVTPRLSSACSNQLSYRPFPLEKDGGAEESRTPDSLLAKQVLYQLSYSPKRHWVPISFLRRLTSILVLAKNGLLKPSPED